MEGGRECRRLGEHTKKIQGPITFQAGRGLVRARSDIVTQDSLWRVPPDGRAAAPLPSNKTYFWSSKLWPRQQVFRCLAVRSKSGQQRFEPCRGARPADKLTRLHVCGSMLGDQKRGLLARAALGAGAQIRRGYHTLKYFAFELLSSIEMDRNHDGKN
jgi:hypothetical protein